MILCVIMVKVIVALTSAPYVKAQKFKCNLTYSPHMRAATFCKCHKREYAGMAAGGRKDIVVQARFGDCVPLRNIPLIVFCPMDWRPATDLYHSRLDFAPFARHNCILTEDHNFPDHSMAITNCFEPWSLHHDR